MTDKTFWLQRWETNDICFHEHETNPSLIKYFQELGIKKGSRVFVPLCGKTLDIGWLLSNGYRVAGAELIELAIQQLFENLRMEPKISANGNLKQYSAKNIDVFVGDIFDLSKTALGPVDATYDRAALIALPPKIRNRYTEHLREITNNAPQLLISLEYDQKLMEGPPFSVSNAEITQHYKDHYNLKHLVSAEIPGGVKGKCPGKQNVWLLTKK